MGQEKSTSSAAAASILTLLTACSCLMPWISCSCCCFELLLLLLLPLRPRRLSACVPLLRLRAAPAQIRLLSSSPMLAPQGGAQPAQQATPVVKPPPHTLVKVRPRRFSSSFELLPPPTHLSLTQHISPPTHPPGLGRGAPCATAVASAAFCGRVSGRWPHVICPVSDGVLASAGYERGRGARNDVCPSTGELR
jgi:hypothetical protein